jgi:hypothetical protein
MATSPTSRDQPIPEDPSRFRGRHGQRVRVQPLGGPVGCVAMLLVSLLASVLLTVFLNVLVR